MNGSVCEVWVSGDGSSCGGGEVGRTSDSFLQVPASSKYDTIKMLPVVAFQFVSCRRVGPIVRHGGVPRPLAVPFSLASSRARAHRGAPTARVPSPERSLS